MALSLGSLLSIYSVGAAATIAGGIFNIAGSVQQHEQAKANAKMQAQQMNYNKRLEEREAARVESETAENARRQRVQAEYLKSRQRAMLGKSGAAMSSGSPLAVLGQTAADQELGIQDTLVGGYQQAAQHREQAKMYDYQARVAKAQAPSGSSLALNIAGQAVNTAGNLVQLGIGVAGLAKK